MDFLGRSSRAWIAHQLASKGLAYLLFCVILPDMKVMKSSTEFITRLGETLRPHDETEGKAQAMAALVILTGLIVAYIIFEMIR